MVDNYRCVSITLVAFAWFYHSLRVGAGIFVYSFTFTPALMLYPRYRPLAFGHALLLLVVLWIF